MNAIVKFLQHSGRLIGRVTLGGIMVAHGWRSLVGGGTGDLATGLGNQNVPGAELFGKAQTYLELVGGGLLVLGLLTPVIALLFAVEQLAIIALVSLANGFWNHLGGWEYNAALVALALMVATHGSGLAGLDALFIGRRERAGRRREREYEQLPDRPSGYESPAVFLDEETGETFTENPQPTPRK